MSGFGPRDARRPSMTAVLGGGAVVRGTVGVKALRDLSWRQRYNGREFYELDLASGAKLSLKQTKRGEVEGLGTGGTVWPAAHVLARYVERRFAHRGEAWTCLELGAGTGASGLAAACCGASRVALTDYPEVLWLAEENAARNAALTAGADVSVSSMDWAAPEASACFASLREGLGETFDVVLASECVLPQLYPLEPLVRCLGAVVGDATLALVAVEERTFPAYDVKARFFALCAAAGLRCSGVDARDLDAKYRSDDIEIWAVVRASAADGDALFRGAREDRLVVEKWGGPVAEVALRGKTLAFDEDPRAGVGAASWPSSVAVARAILGDAFGFTIAPGALVLDLGAGAGLLAGLLASIGCRVIATDLAKNVPRLEANLEKNALFSPDLVPPPGYATARALPWGEPLPPLPDAIDAVVAADCAYDGASVDGLVATLAALFAAGARPALIVANEQRTCFDAFLRKLAKIPDAPLLIPVFDATPDLWKIDCADPARQPPPIALFATPPPPPEAGTEPSP